MMLTLTLTMTMLVMMMMLVMLLVMTMTMKMTMRMRRTTTTASSRWQDRRGPVRALRLQDARPAGEAAAQWISVRPQRQHARRGNASLFRP
jgi:hypothetical protein